MGPSQTDSRSRSSSKRRFYGASEDVHKNSFRSQPLQLPGTPHMVQMKRVHGVELLLVLLEDENEAYCSLRYLEATLGKLNLQETMNELGLSMKTITVKDTGILPDIIHLRSGILEKEPILIKYRAAECIVKNIVLSSPDNVVGTGNRG